MRVFFLCWIVCIKTLCALISRRDEKLAAPESLRTIGNAAICFPAPNQIAVLDPDNPEKSQIVEFPTGQLVTKLYIAARVATSATQVKYFVVRGGDKQNEVSLFDREADKILKTQEEAEMDVSGQTLSVYSRKGKLKLVHIPDDRIEAETILPRPLLPRLRTGTVSPSLDTIVLGIRGDAGLFRTATGTQVMPFKRLQGAWFAGDDELYLAASREDGSPEPVKKVNPNRETAADIWPPPYKSDPGTTILTTHLGGPVLFVLEQPAIYVSPNRYLGHPGQSIRSKLRALDLKS